MINKNIWGTICDCGFEVYDFFDEHPWMNQVSEKEIICNACGRVHKVDNVNASKFYNNKIFSCFGGLSGKVLEIGCGGGLVTEYVRSLKDVSYLATLDIDDESIIDISNKHYQMDLNDFNENIFDDEFDYVICRDVLMYLENIEYTFSRLAKVSKKVILLNWYDVNHKNCFNKTTPENIFKILSKYYDNLIIEYPYFYKNGYLIKSE